MTAKVKKVRAPRGMERALSGRVLKSWRFYIHERWCVSDACRGLTVARAEECWPGIIFARPKVARRKGRVSK